MCTTYYRLIYVNEREHGYNIQIINYNRVTIIIITKNMEITQLFIKNGSKVYKTLTKLN